MLLGACLAATTQGPVASEVPEINACALLEPAEITKILGVEVTGTQRADSGVGSNGAYSSTCFWPLRVEGVVSASVDDRRNRRNFVILNAHRWPAGSGRAGSFLEDFRKAARHGDIPSQPQPRSVGDESLWWGDGLAVRRGDVSFGLSVFTPALKSRSSQQPGAWEERLAAHILPRIDQIVATEEK